MVNKYGIPSLLSILDLSVQEIDDDLAAFLNAVLLAEHFNNSVHV